jgi:hypothetical protein
LWHMDEIPAWALLLAPLHTTCMKCAIVGPNFGWIWTSGIFGFGSLGGLGETSHASCILFPI